MVWPAGMGSVLRTSLALVPMLLAPHFDTDADSREAAARESEALQLSMVALQFWDGSAEELTGDGRTIRGVGFLYDVLLGYEVVVFAFSSSTHFVNMAAGS